MPEVEKVYDWFIQDYVSNIYKVIGRSEKDMMACPCPIKQKIEGTERDRSTLPGIVKEINAAIDDGDASGVFELKEELIEQIEIEARRLVDRMTDGLHVAVDYDVVRAGMTVHHEHMTEQPKHVLKQALAEVMRRTGNLHVAERLAA